ncbi:hypothetical protein EOD42_23205 [Rhodovarius crocodyli]|uniref:Pectate lyase superfamily protein domain-containing protein n=1 Tax=Rhodovarius crocodyli TaxID=1979269 RepID=A0A437LZ86_9PROT|nr:hypothetical protein [Rhodovarius crocodyli]RVT90712.1 hypothetical protein EOD42_23205 [Rhodovarius crocodyli]
MTNATGLPVTGMTAAQLPLSNNDLMMVVQGSGASSNRQAPLSAIRSVVGPQYDARVFGLIKGTTLDQSDTLQAAIDTVAGQGGGVLNIQAGTFYVKNIYLRSGVYLIGAGKGFTILKMPAAQTAADVVTVENFDVLVGTRPVTTGFPVDFGLGNLTINGNGYAQGDAITGTSINSKGRGLAVYGLAFNIVGPLAIIDCWRHTWYCDGPPAGHAGDGMAGMGMGGPFWLNNGNISREADGGFGSAVGCSVFFNGVADSRYGPGLIGWSQGGAGIKFGTAGTGDWLNWEVFGGAMPEDYRAQTWRTGTSITRSGTTATITFPTPHGFRVGEQGQVYSGGDAGFNILMKVTAVPTATTLQYTLDAATGANFTGEVIVVPMQFPQWALITEAAGIAFWGNLSGGYLGQAKILASNCVFETLREDYLIAGGPPPRAGLLQGGFQIGDATHAVSNTRIRSKFGDILGTVLNLVNSGGGNDVEIIGWRNYAGGALVTGTRDPSDEVYVRAFGTGPDAYARRLPDGFAAMDGDNNALSLYANSGGKARLDFKSQDGTTQLWGVEADSGGIAFQAAGANQFIMDGIGWRSAVAGRELGGSGARWSRLWLTSLPTSAAGLSSGDFWRDAAAGNVVKQVP